MVLALIDKTGFSMTSVFKNTSDLIVEDGFDSYAASSVSYYLN